MYICLEGMDGCGKSSVAKLIKEKLGEDCVLVRFPSDENFGCAVRACLEGKSKASKSSMIFAFAADGVDVSQRVIIPAVKAGKVVISDRHPLVSALVYQLGDHTLAFINHVRSLAAVAGSYDPSFLIYLDVEPEVALGRMSTRDKYEDVMYEPTTLEVVKQHREAYRRAYEQTKGIWWGNSGTAEEMAEGIISRFKLRERLSGSRSRRGDTKASS